MSKPGDAAHFRILEGMIRKAKQHVGLLAGTLQHASEAVGLDGRVGDKLYMAWMAARKAELEIDASIRYLKDAEKARPK